MYGHGKKIKTKCVDCWVAKQRRCQNMLFSHSYCECTHPGSRALPASPVCLSVCEGCQTVSLIASQACHFLPRNYLAATACEMVSLKIHV